MAAGDASGFSERNFLVASQRVPWRLHHQHAQWDYYPRHQTQHLQDALYLPWTFCPSSCPFFRPRRYRYLSSPSPSSCPCPSFYRPSSHQLCLSCPEQEYTCRVCESCPPCPCCPH